MISFRKVLKHNFWKVASLNDGSNTEKYIDYFLLQEKGKEMLLFRVFTK